MALLSSILGFSAVGLAARIGQLGIQKRNLFESQLCFVQIPPVRVTERSGQISADMHFQWQHSGI